VRSSSGLDQRLLIAARTSGHTRWTERGIAAFSRSGEHAACWLVLGAAGTVLSRGGARRRAWRRGVGVVAGSYALNQAVKFTIRRPRPKLGGLPPLSPTVSRLSFPSAHATTSFAAARAYQGLVPAWALYGAAVLFAVSRPYLGVHYPSDVIVGAALGTVVAQAWPR
jgi:membrane-associated phospholipid phosphatase